MAYQVWKDARKRTGDEQVTDQFLRHCVAEIVLAENDCWTRPRVNWQRECARLVEEQRAKAMEAAARVLAVFEDDPKRCKVYLDALLTGETPRHGSGKAALEVLRAFEIVK